MCITRFVHCYLFSFFPFFVFTNYHRVFLVLWFCLQVVLKSYYNILLTNEWSDYFKNKDTINAQFSKREIDLIGRNSFVLYKTYLFTYAILIVFFAFYNLIKPQIFKKCKYYVSYYRRKRCTTEKDINIDTNIIVQKVALA